MRRICCLCKKKMTHHNGSFFSVPFDERKRRIWSEICRMQFTKYAYVCEDHFLSSDIIRGSKNNLMPSAVPFVLPLLEHPMPDGHAGTSSTNLNNNCSQDVLDISMEVSFVDPEEPMEYVDAHTQTDPTILESKLQKENEEYRALVKNLQEDNEVLRRKLAKTNVAVTFMRSIFTEGQMRKMMTHGKIRWKRNDISNAIRLHASGPKAYNYLYKKGFPLPQVSELEHCCRKVNINEVFLTSSLGFIKHCTELTNEDKICVISFDEMKVVETNGSHSMGESANYVQVVMARGLWKSWKRPVFCDFDCQMKKDVLCSIITNLSEAGFQVVAMVCDMASSNRKLWKDLLVTTDKPWFPNPVNLEEKVFTFADAPHLLELIRYHYLDTGLMFNNKLLTSRTIADLMEYTSNSDTSIKLKLTEEHLSMKGVGGQKLAAQLFSNTTANAIRHCDSVGMNLNKSTETADLIQLVNDWFDVLNSTINTFSSPGKEPFGIALTDQQRILMRMNKLMSSPIIPNKTSLEYFQEGVIITNTALEMMYDYVKQKFNMTYILTNQLNQDVLKNVFGAIRSKGGSGGDHPTLNEFKYRLRKYILEQNMEHLHATESMESGTTEWLSSTDTLAIRKYIGKQKVTDEFLANGEPEVLHEIVADRDPEVLDELDTENFGEVDILEDGDLVEYISA